MEKTEREDFKAVDPVNSENFKIQVNSCYIFWIFFLLFLTIEKSNKINMPNSYTFTQWVNHLFYNLSLFSFYIYKTQMKKS